MTKLITLIQTTFETQLGLKYRCYRRRTVELSSELPVPRCWLGHMTKAGQRPEIISSYLQIKLKHHCCQDKVIIELSSSLQVQ
jgi:hypothetical protein